MITKWSVTNFKSIAKETELELAPLTIFAGANSSGKSSVLQSILLISQTLMDKVESRPIVLNGACARLGQFDDLKSRYTELDQITIAWEFEPISNSPIFHRNPFFRIKNMLHTPLKKTHCTVSFDANPGSPDSDYYQLQPRLYLSSFSPTVQFLGTPERIRSFTISQGNFANPLRTLYKIALDENSRAEIRRDCSSMSIMERSCEVKHFVPSSFFVTIPETEALAMSIYEALTFNRDNGVSFPFYFYVASMKDALIPISVIDFLKINLNEKFVEFFPNDILTPDENGNVSFMEWARYLDGIDTAKKDRLRTFLAPNPLFVKSIQDVLSETIMSKRDIERWGFPYKIPEALSLCSDYTEIFFSRYIKYLGPLRDEPKAIYALELHSDPYDVGQKGENTAAVLNLNYERRIEYFSPSYIEHFTTGVEPTRRSLGAAVTDWLIYLGVAESVNSIDRGKLGHELKVTLSAEDQGQDLTHVGVGVSQVLPILVMSLLAERDTTLIFEQPELHLHPKVQTRLGDFFLSMSLLGKQCVIETHSEYMINRLRFRAARDGHPNRVTELLKLYFVEKPHGTSVFRDIKVNEYGAILDWPEGFFDQSQDEAEAILRAAAQKRKKQKEK